MGFPKLKEYCDIGNSFSVFRSDSSPRGLRTETEIVGTFSHAENQSILIVAITAACISLAVSMVSLRWFLCMKRSFHHHLILMLVVSDSFKAMCFFTTPIVIFVRGELESHSTFSQASGFLLATAVEAADLSVWFITLHTTLYVFRPPQRSVQGGLYNVRYWIYGSWVVLPLLAASLAFTNRSGPAYVTSGTMAYLPKRPFEYRLALAWIPRYIIIFSIIAMYAAIYIYVKVKFRGFNELRHNGSSLDTSSMGGATSSHMPHNASLASPQASLTCDMKSEVKLVEKSSSDNSPFCWASGHRPSQIPHGKPEWEKVDFITTPPAAKSQRAPQLSLEFIPADSTLEMGVEPDIETGVRHSPVRSESTSTILGTRNGSTASTFNTSFTGDTAVTAVTESSSRTTSPAGCISGQTRSIDQLAITRVAIQRQLRFLFVYPLIYLLLWTLPFIQHCLTYTDHYTAHPQFWLSICATCILALQAGVDCVIFTWREKPWRMCGPPTFLGWALQKLETGALRHKMCLLLASRRGRQGTPSLHRRDLT